MIPVPQWVVWGCAVRSTPVACAANPQSGIFLVFRVARISVWRWRYERRLVFGDQLPLSDSDTDTFQFLVTASLVHDLDFDRAARSVALARLIFSASKSFSNTLDLVKNDSGPAVRNFLGVSRVLPTRSPGFSWCFEWHGFRSGDGV